MLGLNAETLRVFQAFFNPIVLNVNLITSIYGGKNTKDRTKKVHTNINTYISGPF